MKKEPAYHSGLSRLGRESSSRRRLSHQARWSVSSRAASSSSLRVASDARREGLAVIEGLGGDLPGMVDAHQGRGPAPLIGRELGRVPASAAAGGCGNGPGGMRRREQGAQCPVGGANPGIQGVLRAPWQVSRLSKHVVLHWRGSFSRLAGPRLRRRIRAPARPSAALGKKRGFCPELRHLRRRGTSLCLVHWCYCWPRVGGSLRLI